MVKKSTKHLFKQDNAAIDAEDFLIDCMTQVARLKDKEIATILDLQTIKVFKKGTLLLSEGQYATNCFFNCSGLVRKYYLKEGEERTTNFFMENEVISSPLSSTTGTPSSYYLECVEDTAMSIMTEEATRELFKMLPRLEALSKKELEIQLAHYQELLASYIINNPEERYLNVLNTRPELVQRVPQYQLASYLGIKPESLSRIRKRIMQNTIAS